MKDQRKYIGSIQEYLEDERIVTMAFVADSSKMNWDNTSPYAIDVKMIADKIAEKHSNEIKINELTLTHTTNDLYFIEVNIKDSDHGCKTYRFHLDGSEIEPIVRVFKNDDDADAFLAEFPEVEPVR